MVFVSEWGCVFVNELFFAVVFALVEWFLWNKCKENFVVVIRLLNAVFRVFF